MTIFPEASLRVGETIACGFVAFRSAKVAAFAERKATVIDSASLSRKRWGDRRRGSHPLFACTRAPLSSFAIILQLGNAAVHARGNRRAIRVRQQRFHVSVAIRQMYTLP